MIHIATDSPIHQRVQKFANLLLKFPPGAKVYHVCDERMGIVTGWEMGAGGEVYVHYEIAPDEGICRSIPDSLSIKKPSSQKEVGEGWKA
jgi:hypothetical protein